MEAALFVGFGALVILLPVIINGFPFVFPDSADYLTFNYHLIFRSAFYGLFLFLLHLKTFVWAPVIAQALIVSHLIWVVTRVLLPSYRHWFFLALIVALTIGSSLPIVAGFILADIFTSVMILSIYLLAFQADRLTRMESWYFFLLTCVAISVHLSHLPIALAIFAASSACLLVTRPSQFALRRMAAVFGSIVIAGAAIFLQNLVIHRSPTLSPAGSSFLLANMIEYGPARRYLETACPSAGYKLCAEVDRLPHNSEAVLFTTYPRVGGFAAVRQEAASIVKGTIETRPLEVLAMFWDVVAKAAVAHAPGTELGPLRPPNSTFMEKAILSTFGERAVSAYAAGLQRNDRMPRDLLRLVDDFVFPISFALLLTMVGYALWQRSETSFHFGFIVLAGFAANLTICSIGSGAYDRFQARVSWLLPFAVLLLLARSGKTWKSAQAAC